MKIYINEQWQDLAPDADIESLSDDRPLAFVVRKSNSYVAGCIYADDEVRWSPPLRDLDYAIAQAESLSMNKSPSEQRQPESPLAIIQRHNLSLLRKQNGESGWIACQLTGENDDVGGCYLDDEIGTIDGHMIRIAARDDPEAAVREWVKQYGERT